MSEIVTKENLDTYTQGLKGVLSSMGEAILNVNSSDTRLIVSVRSDCIDADLSGVVITVEDLTTNTIILVGQDGYYYIPIGHTYKISGNNIENFDTPSPITGISTGESVGILMVYELSGFVDMGLPSGLKWAKYPMMTDIYGDGISNTYNGSLIYTSWGNTYKYSSYTDDSNYNTSAGKKILNKINSRDGEHDICFLYNKYTRLPSELDWRELLNNSEQIFSRISRYTGVGSGTSQNNVIIKSNISNKSIYILSNYSSSSTYYFYYWSSTSYNKSNAYALQGNYYNGNGNVSVGTQSRAKYCGIIPVFSPQVRKTVIKITTLDESSSEGLKLIIKDNSGINNYTTDSNGEALIWTEGQCKIKCISHDLNVDEFYSTNIVNINATLKQLDYGYIIIDQTTDNPYKMIIDLYGNTYNNYFCPEVIDNIRKATHCYVGTYNSNTQTMQLKLLDDTDITKYADGTDSSADITSNSSGKYVWVRLPEFYTRATEIETDKWKIEFSFDTTLSSLQPSGNGWKLWGGNDLIGRFVSDYNSSITSRSGASVYYSGYNAGDYKTRISSLGSNFSLMKLKHFNIIKILAYALYGTTNTYNLLGSGNSSSYTTTGENNIYGMLDILQARSEALLFLGLEEIMSSVGTYIGNITFDSNGINIQEDDGTIRSLKYNIDIRLSGYVNKAILGDNLDLFAKANSTTGNSNKGYCLSISMYTVNTYIMYFTPNSLSYVNSTTNSSYHPRLTYKGNIEFV